jgi:SAM-dependent methyltransferase
VTPAAYEGGTATRTAAIWHDVECGAYSADMPLWEELAERCGGEILDLGCGTGRVAMHLARRGYPVMGVDIEPDLVAVANSRAAAAGLEPLARRADACDFALDERVDLILAPMQLAQLLGAEGRSRMLRAAARNLAPAGLLAVALADADPWEGGASPPVPDVREVDGWLYSSTPVAIRHEGGSLVIERLRQTVSPAGELTDELDTVRLDRLAPERLEAEAGTAGLRTVGTRLIAQTDAHEGSTVVLLTGGGTLG